MKRLLFVEACEPSRAATTRLQVCFHYGSEHELSVAARRRARLERQRQREGQPPSPGKEEAESGGARVLQDVAPSEASALMADAEDAPALGSAGGDLSTRPPTSSVCEVFTPSCVVS